MGLPRGSVLLAARYSDALKIISDRKPKMIVTEYEVEGKLGLALIEKQQEFYDDASRVSMIITKNSSDSVVAEAAEEQVDAFLLKPFSIDVFQKKLMDVVIKKMNPSPYILKINQGKSLLQKKDFKAAIEEFQQAKTLEEKPTLAAYYAGQAYLEMGDDAHALAEFQEGRKHQPLHYYCLTGEFEIHIRKKNFAEAYLLVSSIKTNYPLTPRRLGQIFMATVFTRNFDELGGLYELFTTLDIRSDELVKIASMALLTAGKHFLLEKNHTKAIELFDKGLLVSSRDMAYLDKVITELLKSGAHDPARHFLDKAPAHTLGSPEHSRIAFKVDAATLNPEQLVERGRKLIMDGLGTPEIYESVVKLMASAGKLTLAESVIGRALKTNPEMRGTLYKILEDHGPKETN